jgi:hypothetical protein
VSALFVGSYVVLWLLVIVQGFALLELLRQLHAVRLETEDLRPQRGALIVRDVVQTGQPMPDLAARTFPSYELTSWSDWFPERNGVALFVTTRCVTCRSIANQLDDFLRSSGNPPIVVIVQAEFEEVRRFLRATALQPERVAIDERGFTAGALGLEFSPAAVTVVDGCVGEAAIVNSIDQLASLLQRAGTLTPSNLQTSGGVG